MSDYIRDVGKRETEAWLEVDRLRSARDELRAALPRPEFLEWVADRLANVYGDDPNMNFILTLRMKANAGRKALASLNKTDKDPRDKSLADFAALNKTDGE